MKTRYLFLISLVATAVLAFAIEARAQSPTTSAGTTLNAGDTCDPASDACGPALICGTAKTCRFATDTELADRKAKADWDAAIASVKAAEDSYAQSRKACADDAGKCSDVENAKKRLDIARELANAAGIPGKPATAAKPAPVENPTVRAFQVAYGLRADGRLGPKTCDKFQQVSGSAPDGFKPVGESCTKLAERLAKKQAGGSDPVLQALEGLKNSVGGIETRLGGIETRLGGIETRLGEHESRIAALEPKS